MEDLLRKVILAGIGTLSLTYEKANALVKELIEKGQITVEQGKQINEELKRVMDNKQASVESKIEEYINSLNLATKSDIENLIKRIEALEKKINGGN
jgi:polyhydroxyalkanoate synthesis regulator phasin